MAAALSARRRETLTRFVSGAILAAIAAVSLWLGHPLFMAFVMLVGGVMAWEWSRMCGVAPQRLGTLLFGLGVVAAAALAATSRADVALAVVAGTAALVFAAVAATKKSARIALWIAAGAVYVGVPVVAFLWLHGLAAAGPWLILWLCAVVAATDIGAYFAGRSIGGAKLAPRVSPGKTWSGLGGGVALAAAVGGALAAALGLMPAWQGAAGAAVLAVVAQLGDLFESGVKRNFHVKDASGLIPGHGGMLDRVDGLVAATAVAAAALWLNGGRIPAWT
jgi:phosphatidate cytidylyltransferase